MTKYVKAHTKYILEQIQSGNISEELLTYHRTQIANIQHERLIHLIVLCLFALLLIGSFALTIFMPSVASGLLFFILFMVEAFYILHYRLLENTVQQWYKIENTIIHTLKNIGTNLNNP